MYTVICKTGFTFFQSSTTDLDVISPITKYTLLLGGDELTLLNGIDFINEIRASALKIGSRNGHDYYQKYYN